MKSMKVRDVMVSVDQYPTLSEDATLSELVTALEKASENRGEDRYPPRAVIVLDKSGRPIGKVSQLDVLRSLEPNYTEIGDLRKLTGFGLSAEFLRSSIDKYELWKAPLNDLCRKAANLNLGAIVASPVENEVIDQEASLNKAVHQMIMGHHQSLLVTSGDKIVGILKLTDVFRDVGEMIKACQV